MSQVEVLTTDAEIEPYRPEWDALAVEASRPFCLSAWMLAWWRHRDFPSWRLRTVVVRERGRVIGISPFCVDDRGRYRLLGADSFFRIAPLAARGRELDVAADVAGALEATEPRPLLVRYDAIEGEGRWPEQLAAAWPGRGARCHRTGTERTAVLPLAGLTYEEWFASHSKNFRKQMRSSRRRLESAGARFRLVATSGEAERGVAALARLHYARWSWRGGSGALDAAGERMLAEASRELLEAGHLRLWLLEVRGNPICAQLFTAAGGEVASLVSGFDPAWVEARPGLQMHLVAIEHSFRSGDRRLDLGPGSEPYKRRLAGDEAPLAWTAVLPRRRGQLRDRTALVIERLAFQARPAWRRLPRGARAAIRRVGVRPPRA